MALDSSNGADVPLRTYSTNQGSGLSVTSDGAKSLTYSIPFLMLASWASLIGHFRWEAGKLVSAIHLLPVEFAEKQQAYHSVSRKSHEKAKSVIRQSY